MRAGKLMLAIAVSQLGACGRSSDSNNRSFGTAIRTLHLVVAGQGTVRNAVYLTYRYENASPAPGVTEAQKEAEGSATMTGTKRRATGQTKVKIYEPTPYDEMADGPSLFENRVNETFTGDIEGEGTVRVIQAARKDGSATFVGIERVRGAVGGRKGSFLLQINGTDLGRERKAEWFVVPGSGTGDLKGLRGEGGFKAQRGEHGSIWLDYYFE